MGGLLTGVVSGAALSLLSMFALGVLHRYLFGPPTTPFGDPAFFGSMSAIGLLVLILLRLLSAWLGGWVAARMSGEPQAAWTGPAAVLISAMTVIVMGMGQPLWSLILSGLLLLALGWAMSRRAAGLPMIPEGIVPRREG